MIVLKRIQFMMIFLLFMPMALAAQTDPTLPNVDLTVWGASVLVFGFIMMKVVEFAKVRIRNRLPDFHSTWITVLTFVLSVGGAFLIDRTQNLTDANFANFPEPWSWIAYGLVAGAIASGWYDQSKTTQ